MADLNQFTDEEIKDIERGDLSKLSDQKIKMLEGLVTGEVQPIPDLPKFDTGKSSEDLLLSLGQGATAGYLPQVGAAFSSGSISSPEYEKEKQNIRQRMSQRGQLESVLGETAGSFVNPLSIAGAKYLSQAPRVRNAIAMGALQGGLMNPGGDVSASQIPDRLKNALFGGALAGTVARAGKKAAESAEIAANQRAFKATGPQKAQVIEANRMGTTQDIGRELLDKGIITNVPASYETLLERTKAVKNAVGQQKGDIISQLSALVDQFAGHQYPAAKGQSSMAGIDMEAVKNAVRNDISLNPNLPQAEAFGDKLEAFLSNVAQGRKIIPIAEADKLKTDLGKFVRRFYPKGAIQLEPASEQFNKSLYRALNKGVDDAAEVIAENLAPDLLPSLKASKKSYGMLSSAEKNLQNRVETEMANRMVSPSDYGAGLATGMGTLARGASTGQAAVSGTVAAAINQFMRKYGNQLTAKQLDNLSKVIGSSALQYYSVSAPAISTFKKKNRIKALEE